MEYLQLSTLVFAIFIGMSLFLFSHYSKIPPIVLLLFGGIVLGPEFLGLVNPSSLGDGFRLIISISVAIILFEGGLTLNPDGLKKAPKVIWRLLTLGVLITWLSIAGFIYILLDFSAGMSLLAGSLVIVTGPTVIGPLLKGIGIKSNLYHILHWEGVLIDPIGVFIAVLCFEWLSIEGSFVVHLWQLSIRLLVGLVLGYIGGKFISKLLHREVVPEEQSNIFVFASALFLFAVSDLIVHEAGILTVVVSGLVIAWSNPPRLKRIKQFKSELTEISIALVFILLAANLKLANFFVVSWEFIVVLVAVLLIVRPLNIMLCSHRTSLSFNEKIFLSWIAPRGVVAGSMASLFTVKLAALGHSESIFLETFTFSVIVISIVLQGSTASMLARFLKVREPEKKCWLIVGAHPFSRKVGDFITAISTCNCVFLDTNADAIFETRQKGYNAYKGNALSIEVLPANILASIGNVIALTDNRDLNQLICEKWSESIPKDKLYRWSSESSELAEPSLGAGFVIWSFLKKPSQVSYDYKNEKNIFHQCIYKEDKTKNNIILMAENQGKIVFSDKAGLEKASQVLLLEQV